MGLATGGGLAADGQVLPNRASNWDAADHGLLAWTFDPVIAINNFVLATGGTAYVQKLHLPTSASVTNIITSVITAGSTLTSGQCFAALYNAAGTLIGVTGDQSGTWTSTGIKTMALASGPFACVNGDYYTVEWFNGTTGPALARAANSGHINVGLSAASSRFATANTGLTTTAPGTLGALTAFANSIWTALS